MDTMPHTQHYWVGHAGGYLFCSKCKKRKVQHRTASSMGDTKVKAMGD